MEGVSENVKWFIEHGFKLVCLDGKYSLIRNQLNIPIALADSFKEEIHLWKMLWAADNWLAFSPPDNEGKIWFLIDTFALNIDFVLNAPIDAVENVYYQNPSLKVN